MHRKREKELASLDLSPRERVSERARQEAGRKAVPSWSWIPAKSLLVCSSGWSQRLTLLARRAAVLLKHIWRSGSPNSPHIVFLLSPDLALPSRNADKGFTHLLRVSPGSFFPSLPTSSPLFHPCCLCWRLHSSSVGPVFLPPPFSFSLPPFPHTAPSTPPLLFSVASWYPPWRGVFFSCKVAVSIQLFLCVFVLWEAVTLFLFKYLFAGYFKCEWCHVLGLLASFYCLFGEGGLFYGMYSF